MNKGFMRFCGPQIIQTAFTSLCGLLNGIEADKEINSLEIETLKNWFSENIKLKEKQPFAEIFNKFSEIIADENISKAEFDDLLWVCNKFKENGSFYNEATKEIQFLHGLVAGISADNHINKKEIEALKLWLLEKEHLQGTWPYDEFYSLSLSVLSDGVISEEERIDLTNYFKEFLNLNGNKVISNSTSNSLPIKGICVIDPIIDFEYKRFVITGASKKASRSKIQSMIEDCAGQMDDSITQKTDYLIVMSGGNSAWTYSAYGRKVEQAMELRKKGSKIIIIHENDFWDAIREADVA